MESALDQAWKNIGNAAGAISQNIGNFVNRAGQTAQAIGQDFQHEIQPGVQNFENGASQVLGQLPNAAEQVISQSPLGQAYQTSSDLVNSFGSNPQSVGPLAPRLQNLAQGASLGYYRPDQQLQQQYNVSPFEQALETGVGGAAPFIAGSIATGGALDAALAPEAIAALGGRDLLATTGAGLLTGAAAPADSWTQRAENAAGGGVTGLAFGALGGTNPLIQAGVGSLGMAGLTALQGGNKDQILANAVLGLGTPLAFKAISLFGGGDAGTGLMSKLFDQFGTDSYRFMANKDLIQRVVTGQGSPEDVLQFNILNNLGKTAEIARTPGGVSIEDPTTQVPKTGPVWDFLQQVFPSSFKGGVATNDFTNPDTTPMQHVSELELDPHENDALMQIDEQDPHPDNAPQTSDEAIREQAQAISDQATQQLGPTTEVGTPEPSLPEIQAKLDTMKGMSAEDIVAKNPDLNLKRDVPITDVHGNKSVVPKGEALTPYVLKGNKVLLQDGQTYIVSKNQYDNIKGQSITAEAKPFAPELAQTEETRLGTPSPDTIARYHAIEDRAEKVTDEMKSFISRGEQVPAVLDAELAALAKERTSTEARNPSRTNYDQYTLPGGEDYREILLQAPDTREAELTKQGYTIARGEFDDGTPYFQKIDPSGQLIGPRWSTKEAALGSHEGYVYQSSHWSNEPNVLAHLRLKQRVTSKGEPVTFMEELQSDWAREGRDKGFTDPAKTKTLQEAADKAKEKLNGYVDSVAAKYNNPPEFTLTRDAVLLGIPGAKAALTPSEKAQVTQLQRQASAAYVEFDKVKNAPQNHPLLKNWQELAVKRGLQDAVAHKSKYFAWINGDQTTARYNLATHVDKISWEPQPQEEKRIVISPKNSSNELKVVIDKTGKVLYSEAGNGDWNGKTLDEILGKGLADSIMSKDGGELSGEGLKFGGEWANNLYDKQVKNIVEKVTGGKAETLHMGLGISGKEPQFTFASGNSIGGSVTPQDLKLGLEITDRHGYAFIVTKLLGDGKFNAVKKITFDKFNPERLANGKWRVRTPGMQVELYNTKPDPFKYFNSGSRYYVNQFDIAPKNTQGQQAIKITPAIRAKILGEAPTLKQPSGADPLLKIGKPVEQVPESLPVRNSPETQANNIPVKTPTEQAIVVKAPVDSKVAAKFYTALSTKLTNGDFQAAGAVINDVKSSRLSVKNKSIIVKDMLQQTKAAMIKVKQQQAPAPVVTDPTAPNYDFAADMDSHVGQVTDNASPEKKGEALRQIGGLDKVAAANSGNATGQEKPTIKTASGATIQPEAPGGTLPPNSAPSGVNFSSQPKGGYFGAYQRAMERIIAKEPVSWPTDHQFEKVTKGRREVHQDIGKGILDETSKLIPDAKQREAVLLAIDDDALVPQLKTAEQKTVYAQLKGLHELMATKSRELDPHFKTIENYFQRVDISPQTKAQEQSYKALSETTKADMQRSIWKFVPEDGQGKPFIASTTAKSFPLHQSAEDPMLWQDDQGKAYMMAHATVPEIEKSGLAVYEKDAGKVAAKSITDFLNKKDNTEAVNWFKSGAAADHIFLPGEVRPANAKPITNIRGLEGIYATPQLNNAFNKLSPNPDTTPLEEVYGKIESYPTQLILYNVFKHSLNIFDEALRFAGNAKTGNKFLDTVGLHAPIGMARYVGSLKWALDTYIQKPEIFWQLKDQGAYAGNFHKDETTPFIERTKRQPSTLVKGAKLVGKYNPITAVNKLYDANGKATGFMDSVMRLAMYKLNMDSGMSMQDAVKTGDDDMVDYSNVSRNEQRLGSLLSNFYPWFKGQANNYVKMGLHPKQNSGAIINSIILGALYLGAVAAWKEATGNQQASIDASGQNSFASQAIGSLEDTKNLFDPNATHKVIPRMIASHLGRPVAKELLQQGFNTDLFSGNRIYDKMKQGFNGAPPPTEGQARMEHVTNSLIPPASPFLKVTKGKQTTAEAVANYVGFKTPHAQGSQAAPASGPIANALNDPNATPGTGIDLMNAKASIANKLTPEQQSRLTDINSLISDQYNGGNPLGKFQAYSLLQADPQIAMAKSQIEVATAKSKNEPPAPIWAIGLIDPDAQKVILQYKAMLPADQKAFKAVGNHQQVLNAYNALNADYYAKVPASAAAQASGITPPVASQEVSTLLDQYTASKAAGHPNYALLDDPRVQQYYGQLDFYDAYINNLAGLGPNTQGSGSGSGSRYTPSSKYSLRNSLLYNAENAASASLPTVKLGNIQGPALNGIKVNFGNPTAQTGKVKLPDGFKFGTPSIGKVGFTQPAQSKINMTQPRYTP